MESENGALVVEGMRRRRVEGGLDVEEEKEQPHTTPTSLALSPATKKWQIGVIYFIGFMDLFSISMMIPFYSRLSLMLGATPSIAGLIGSLYGVIQVFSSPIVGKLSDRYGRKKLLVLSYLVPSLGYLLLSLAAYQQSLLLLIISKVPSGLMKHGVSIGKAYLTDITDSKERQGALGYFNACSSLGFIFGPLISGYLADYDQTFFLCMLCGALTFSLNVIFVLLLVKPIQAPPLAPPPSPRTNTNRTRISNSKSDNLSEILTFKEFLSSINVFRGAHWWLMADLILIKFLSSLSVLMYRNNLGAFVQGNFDTNYKTLGKIMSFNGIAGALAAATCGRISRLYSSSAKQMTHFLFILAFALLGSTLAPNFWIVVLMLVPLSFATANLRICTLNLFLSRVTEEEKGEVIGLGYSITSLSRMMSPSLVGVAQEWSPQLAGYASSALACSAAVAVVTCSFKSSSKLN